MKKRIIAVMLIGAFVLSGCALADRFAEAKDAYLESRVAELLAEDALAEDAVEEEVPVEEAATEEVEQAEEPEVKEAEEAAVEETEEPEEDADAEETDTDADETDPDAEDEAEVDATPVVESDDPGVYLGDADWIDDMEPGEYYWPLDTDNYMSAAYVDGTLELKALSEINGWRIASTPVLGDSYIEAVVKMGDCSNTDGYGFIFNVPENVAHNRGYLFGVTCDGKYSLRKWDGLSGENGTMIWMKYYTENEYVNQGEDATNTIGVMTIGDSISLYVNGEMVEEIIDDTYTEGFFGLYINRDFTENLTINIDRVSYWTDPLE